MLRFTLALVIGNVLFLHAALRAAENWPHWRGPTANGVAVGKSYPTKWSKTEGVSWKYKLPGLGASTPTIWGDNIVITGENKRQNSVLCLSRAGKKKWEVSLGAEAAGRHRKASGSNSSPVIDGKHIFVYFKSGDFACLDMRGKVVWRKNLQKLYGQDTLWWDLGTSPVLTSDHVVVACMQSGGSYLAGLDKLTGKQVWKVDRNLDAPGESAQSYTTPVVFRHNDKQQIAVLGADHVTAHDAKTGKRIWIAGGLNPQGYRNWRSISSPVVAGDLLIAPYARGRSLTAIRLGGKGNVTRSHLAWSNDGPAADVPCPVYHQGKVYICTDRGQVAILDAKSGKTLDSQRVPGRRATFSASPVLADGHLYVSSENGTTTVFQVGKKLKMVAQNKLEDFTIASPVFADGRAYLRTDLYVWCIAKKNGK